MNRMYSIQAKNLTDAWVKTCRLVSKIDNKQADHALTELLNVFIHIENGFEVRHKLYFQYFPKQTYDSILSIYQLGRKKYHGHNYASRIYNHHGLDQLEKIKHLLKRDPITKSASIILSDPISDRDYIPCIMDLNFKIRNERLIMTLVFKSCDVAKKFIPDVFSLSQIHAQLSRELQVARGEITIFIMSAQIHKQDYRAISKLLATRHRIVSFDEGKMARKWDAEADSWETHIKKKDHYVNIGNGYGRYIDFMKTILQSYPITSFDRIVDLGCGTGIIARFLLRYSRSVFGVDIAENMLERARAKTRKVKFLLANSLDVPLSNEYCKVVISRGVLLSHIGKYFFRQQLQEVHRILKKNGYYVFDFLSNVPKTEVKLRRNKAIFTRKQITEELSQNGFQIIDFSCKPEQRVNAVFCIKK